jgi:hypothetical protein
MQGKNGDDIMRFAAGKIALRGENLKIHGRDLDQGFDRFQPSQDSNLVDASALFIVGPIGLLVARGYNFASILQCPGGNSQIQRETGP